MGQWVNQWLIVSDLEIAIASPSFVSLFLIWPEILRSDYQTMTCCSFLQFVIWLAHSWTHSIKEFINNCLNIDQGHSKHNIIIKHINLNIARGTTDPGYSISNMNKFSDWKLQNWPPDGVTCISCKFGHQMAPLTLVTNLVNRRRHMHLLHYWLQNFPIRLSHLHCHIALDCPVP